MNKLFFLIIAALAVQAIHAQQKLQTKNLVIITLDGYRWQELFQGSDSGLLNDKKFVKQKKEKIDGKYWRDNLQQRRTALMPFVWNYMAKNGQLYGNRTLQNFVNVKNPYWFSFPGYNEIFTGYPDTLINSNAYPDNPNTNVLEYINQQKPFNKKVAAFCSWDAFSQILNEKRSGFLINNGFDHNQGSTSLTHTQQTLNDLQDCMHFPSFEDMRPDALTYNMAKEYISLHHPRVNYISFGATDHFGHAAQYDFYLDAAHDSDEMIKDLWQYLQKDPFYKNNTTFIITCDHGRGEGEKWTSHKSTVPHSDQTWLMVMGPDTEPLGEISSPGQLYNDQFASTIAAFLSLNFTPRHPAGKRITSVMKTN